MLLILLPSCCSMFFGNLFVFFKFQGKTHIDEETRFVVFIVLVSVAAVGVVFLALLRPATNEDGELAGADNGGPVAALKRSLQLIGTKEILFLCVTFFYTGDYSWNILLKSFCSNRKLSRN